MTLNGLLDKVYEDMDALIKEFLKKNAKKGGQAVLSKYGKQYFSENGKKSGVARTGKKRGKYKKRSTEEKG